MINLENNNYLIKRYGRRTLGVPTSHIFYLNISNIDKFNLQTPNYEQRSQNYVKSNFYKVFFNFYFEILIE